MESYCQEEYTDGTNINRQESDSGEDLLVRLMCSFTERQHHEIREPLV